MKIVVSACLTGKNCKYNGGNNYSLGLAEFLKGKEILEVCPEMAGGLPAPRESLELADGRACTREGKDLDEVVRKGVAITMEELEGEEIALAVLQSRSPTCGVNQVYDGTFTGTLIPGQGIFAQELKRRGIPVMDIEDLKKELSGQGVRQTGTDQQ